jgi:hypothetical protein
VGHTVLLRAGGRRRGFTVGHRDDGRNNFITFGLQDTSLEEGRAGHGSAIISDYGSEDGDAIASPSIALGQVLGLDGREPVGLLVTLCVDAIGSRGSSSVSI